ncbi:MAG TPA: zf-HC2 domain-containing protein [Candidatus Manganitrophaceae bacterium]|nr:zf-HC2 domain-containing protein [Candidatus Manganitrophaceae bacterium]
MKKLKAMGCEEALKHLFTYLDRELGAVKRRGVERHLALCRSCFSRAEFEKRLKDQLRETGRESVTASFKERIKTILSQL